MPASGSRRDRRRRRRSRLALPPALIRGLASAQVSSALTTVALVAGLVGAAAFLLPVQDRSTHEVPFEQRLTFDYQGSAAPGPVYPAGTISWGQPIYPRLVPSVDVSVRHEISGPVTGPVTGTLTLVARLESATGWRGPIGNPVSVPLSVASVVQTPTSPTAAPAPSAPASAQPTTAFGAGTTAVARIDLTGIAARTAQVERASGAALGPLQLVVDATADLTATVQGQLVHTTFTRPLDLRLDASQIVLSGTDATSAQTGAATVPRVAPRTVVLLGVGLQVVWLRRAAVLTGVGCLLLAGLVLYAKRRQEPAEREPERLYPDRNYLGLDGRGPGAVVRLRPPSDDASVVDVESMSDLMALADHTGEPVLTYGSGPDAAFLLEYGSRRYRYAAGHHFGHASGQSSSGAPVPSPRPSERSPAL